MSREREEEVSVVTLNTERHRDLLGFPLLEFGLQKGEREEEERTLNLAYCWLSLTSLGCDDSCCLFSLYLHRVIPAFLSYLHWQT